jgi:hypothetical protein
LSGHSKSIFKHVPRLALLAGLALLPAGCTYDYLQNSDQVSYRAGNAVRANLAMETTNPWRADMYDARGLGKNGSVIPATPAATSGTSSSTAAAP